jgi:uncharacterized protein (TIRG00374 family)
MNVPNQNRNFLKYFVGFSATSLCLLFIARKVEFQEVFEATRSFNFKSLLFGLLCLFIGYCFRIFRWQFILKTMGADVNFRQCINPFLGSIALNNILPLRLGDVIRATIYPRKLNIPTSLGISSLVLERFVDTCLLGFFLLFGLTSSKQIVLPNYVERSVYALFAICAASICIFFIVDKLSGLLLAKQMHRIDSLTNSAIKLVLNTVGNIKLLLGLREVTLLILIGSVVWLGEAGLIFFLLQGVGLPPTIPIALFITAMISIATIIPSLPGYIGPFHLAAFLAISLIGGSAAQGASFALVAHFTLWAPTTIFGVIAISLDKRLLKSTKKLFDRNEEE